MTKDRMILIKLVNGSMIGRRRVMKMADRIIVNVSTDKAEAFFGKMLSKTGEREVHND